MAKKTRALKATDWQARAVPVIRDHLSYAYRNRARRASALTAQVRAAGINLDRTSPLYDPDFVDATSAELIADANSLDQADLYWVTAKMGALAAEYADSDAPWRPNVEAPSEHGFLLFESTTLTVCPLPPHGVPTLDGEQFASWVPDNMLPEGMPRVPLAGIRWALRGDRIDISFYVRKANLIEVFTKADEEGNLLRPRELVHTARLIGELGTSPHALNRALSLLPETVPWMSTYTLDSETELIEWERAELSADEDFSAIQTERSLLSKADPTNGLWLAGTIVPSVWTMMRQPKVVTRSQTPVVRVQKSPTGKTTTIKDSVSVVDVRPYEYRPHTEGTGRKISVRFLVRGHMSTYWTGQGRTVPRRTFIAPYWKGDPSMPIKETPKVKVLR